MSHTNYRSRRATSDELRTVKSYKRLNKHMLQKEYEFI